tara:strand:- start:10044 stop:10367 length:324 start_codon:yes stop_codon:yes gene_type:complete
MSWEEIIRKKIDTATRSAELWIMNEYDVYKQVLAYIKSLVLAGYEKEELMGKLANWLPSIMIHMEGFMQELETEDYDGSTDSINDVDWDIVAENYEDDVDTIIEDYS